MFGRQRFSRKMLRDVLEKHVFLVWSPFAHAVSPNTFAIPESNSQKLSLIRVCLFFVFAVRLVFYRPNESVRTVYKSFAGKQTISLSCRTSESSGIEGEIIPRLPVFFFVINTPFIISIIAISSSRSKICTDVQRMWYVLFTYHCLKTFTILSCLYTWIQNETASCSLIFALREIHPTNTYLICTSSVRFILSRSRGLADFD